MGLGLMDGRRVGARMRGLMMCAADLLVPQCRGLRDGAVVVFQTKAFRDGGRAEAEEDVGRKKNVKL